MAGLAALGGVFCWLVWPLAQSWAVTVLLLPHLLPVSVAVHEAGHVLGALAAGHPAGGR